MQTSTGIHSRTVSTCDTSQSDFLTEATLLLFFFTYDDKIMETLFLEENHFHNCIFRLYHRGENGFGETIIAINIF